MTTPTSAQDVEIGNDGGGAVDPADAHGTRPGFKIAFIGGSHALPPGGTTAHELMAAPIAGGDGAAASDDDIIVGHDRLLHDQILVIDDGFRGFGRMISDQIACRTTLWPEEPRNRRERRALNSRRSNPREARDGWSYDPRKRPRH